MRSLVVKCIAGTEDAERCNQAFTVAATAAAAGAEVSLWLAGEAVWLGVPGRAEEFTLELAGSLAEARDLIIDEGRMVVCAQCAARRGITAADLVDGVGIAGAAAFTEEILADGVQALVYEQHAPIDPVVAPAWEEQERSERAAAGGGVRVPEGRAP